MNALRKTKKSTLYFWIALLSVALLCAQEVKLHVHGLGHDHDFQHSHTESLAAVEHTHLSIAHLSTDVSHIDHHDEVLSESDACPDCLLTKISNIVPVMALLAVLFMFVLFGLYRSIFNHRQDDDLSYSRRCHFLPPLRAPPVKPFL